MCADLLEAKVLVEDYRKHYNHHRPHSALGYQTPAEFGASADLDMKVEVPLPAVAVAECVDLGQLHADRRECGGLRAMKRSMIVPVGSSNVATTARQTAAE